MSANRQILARPGGPSRSIQVNQKRSSARTMSAFVPNGRRWMRRIYHGLIQSGRPRLPTRVRTTQNYSACLIDGMAHNSHALSGAGVLVAVVSRKRSPRLLAVISAIAFSAFLGQRSSRADESGVSFWQPGTFANLAAVPGLLGWSFSAAVGVVVAYRNAASAADHKIVHTLIPFQ
jgi:hypothetical protein